MKKTIKINKLLKTEEGKYWDKALHKHNLKSLRKMIKKGWFKNDAVTRAILENHYLWRMSRTALFLNIEGK